MNFAGFLRTRRMKAQKFWGKFRSISREKIRAPKKYFVPISFCRRATPRGKQTGGNDISWRPGPQYNVAVTRGADSVLASDRRAHFGRPSTRRGCRIGVTVQLLVRPCGETMYWQANVNTPLSVTPEPLLNVPAFCLRYFRNPYNREPPKHNSGNQIIFTKCPKNFKVYFGEFKFHFGGNKVYFFLLGGGLYSF